jgi:hypothetical protein
VQKAEAVSIATIRRWTWGPPGVLFFLGTGIAALVALDANSRQAFVSALEVQVVWALLALLWLIRFVGALWSKRLRLQMRHVLRWLLIPAVLAVVFLYTRTDEPYDLRLSLSRDGMNEAATEVMAGGSTDRGWIGLFPVERVERISNGMRFLIAGSGFIDGIGLAYSTDSQPDGIEGTDEYEPIGDGWWRWVERFN